MTTPPTPAIPLTADQIFLREWAFAGAAEEAAQQQPTTPLPHLLCSECGCPSEDEFFCLEECRDARING